MHTFSTVAMATLLALNNPNYGQPSNASHVERAEFIVSAKGEDREWTTTTSDKVPLRPGDVCYRWRIRLTSPRTEEIAWIEEFTLPKAPEVWEHSNKFETIDDGRTTVTRKSQIPTDGWIENGWCVAEGDPAGKYLMKIYVQGSLAHSFEFMVE